jgi:p-aminobenzoyl-glutamate transporter AbgT
MSLPTSTGMALGFVVVFVVVEFALYTDNDVAARRTVPTVAIRGLVSFEDLVTMVVDMLRPMFAFARGMVFFGT